MAFQAYMDESGGVGQSRVFVMAGFLASAETWIAFGDDWDAALKKPPRLEYFKMREADSLSGQFKNWGRTQRDARLKDLAVIIKKHSLHEIACTVNAEAFAYFPFRQMLPHPANNPYFLAFHSVIVMVADYLDSIGEHEKFEIIFDVNEVFGHKAKLWYPLVRVAERNSAKASIFPVDPIFRDDKATYPLQAADLAAWLARDVGQRNNHWLQEDLKDVNASGHFILFDDLANMAKSQAYRFTSEQNEAWDAILRVARPTRNQGTTKIGQRSSIS